MRKNFLWKITKFIFNATKLFDTNYYLILCRVLKVIKSKKNGLLLLCKKKLINYSI